MPTFPIRPLIVELHIRRGMGPARAHILTIPLHLCRRCLDPLFLTGVSIILSGWLDIGVRRLVCSNQDRISQGHSDWCKLG